MKTLLCVVGLVLLGCGDGSSTDPPPTPIEPTTDAFLPVCVPNVIVETKFPSVGLGDFVMLCTACNANECASLGNACNAYGEQCAVGNMPGVCVGCCNGETGELHCSPHQK